MIGTIHYMTPFSSEKDLGKAYNKCFEVIGENDWVCLRDLDTMFLTHDAPNIIEKYVKQLPNTGIFTCYTNRISLSSSHQLLNPDRIDDRSDIRAHIELAELRRNMVTHTELKSIISGFLMVISKRTWNTHKFDEGQGCLGIDNKYSQRILNSGLKIIRINSLYVWHSYRLLTGVYHRKHLQ